VRFGLLAGAVGLLVFLILFQQALLTGLVNQFIGALKNQSADVLVFNAQARKNLEGSIILPEQAAAVAEVDGVADAQPLGEGTFTVVAGGEERDAVLFGYTLGGPGEPTTLLEGRLPTATGEAVASSRNAADGFDIGDRVEVVASAGAEPVVFTVVGLAREINYSVSPVLFTDFAGFEAAKRSFNPDATEVLPTVMAVRVADGADAGDVAAAITAQVPGTEALTRQQAVDGSPGVSSVRQSFNVILLLFYLVVPLVTGLSLPAMRGIRTNLAFGDKGLNVLRSRYWASRELQDTSAVMAYTRVSAAMLWKEYAVVTVHRPMEQRDGSALATSNGGGTYIFHRVGNSWLLLVIARSWG
jgi:putative ABC transport system permease protein